MILEKNKTYTASCSALGSEGEGIVKIDGFTVFVEGMLPGETGELLIVKLKKNYGYGKLIKLLTESADRVSPSCPYAKTCGGCSLQHMSYAAQLSFKRDKVKDCLERIGGLTDIELPDTIGMEIPWNYRNKAQYPVGLDKNGKAVMGFYAPRSHRLTAIDRCMLQKENADSVISAVKGFIDDFRIPVYSEEKHSGLIRHILTRTAFYSGEIMVTIVVNGKRIPHADELIRRLATIDGIASVVMNINTDKTNVILGRKSITLWGKDTIRDTIGDISFDISSLSFYQVNPVQTEKLYSLAVDAAELKKSDTVIDVYCGIGTIALFASQRAGKVHGIEIVPQAIEDAKHNAEINGISNVTFEAGKAEDILPRMYNEGKRADVIFLDPPRKGLEPSVIDAVASMKPDRIVYVSCGPATLARDLKLFKEKGYETKKAQTVDMFCQTPHVETVVSLTRSR
ncbi:MAG: 23S rRNA (uracil(1939)-C(5))-methyltransferase RlmD [Clostridia bacterium]|nr:23S rRNA (uracil(1939)-C(5))-methyltransferase RlmD [Clostridia bacterium]